MVVLGDSSNLTADLMNSPRNKKNYAKFVFLPVYKFNFFKALGFSVLLGNNFIVAPPRLKSLFPTEQVDQLYNIPNYLSCA